MINYIEIETCNICTRSCSWCFYGCVDEYKNRKLEYLATEYIENVLIELKQHEYKGILSLFSMNEPLVDERIINGSLIKLCKKILINNVIINIVTNGDLLTNDIMSTIIDAGLDSISISCYDDNAHAKAKIMQKLFGKVIKFAVYDFRKRDEFNNRAGNVDIGKKYNQAHVICLKPVFTSIIGWNGEVRLCCNDARSQMNLGNIKYQKFYSILNSEKLKRYRRIITTNRNKISLCKQCDYDGK